MLSRIHRSISAIASNIQENGLVTISFVLTFGLVVLGGWILEIDTLSPIEREHLLAPAWASLRHLGYVIAIFSGLLFVCGIVWLAHEGLDSGWDNLFDEGGLGSMLIAFAILAPLLAGMVVFLICGLWRVVSLLVFSAPLGGAAVALAIAFVLFAFRFYFRALYGLSEIFMGLIAAFDRLSNFRTLTEVAKHTNTALLLGILSASVYLMVRGMVNVGEGISKKDGPPKDRFVQWILHISGRGPESA